MTIRIGERLPHALLQHLTAEGMAVLDTAQIFAIGRYIIFGVPGAYTPTCSAKHLPGYIKQADAFKQQGIDGIYCLAVNDPFVMKAWLAAHNAADIIQPLADGNAAFTKALGLDYDASAHGMGIRSKRFAMLVEDGIVRILNVEAPGQFGVSSAESMFKELTR